MTREPITDEVVEQLRDVLEADALDDEHNYVGARLAAVDRGHDELAAFVDAADAATYHEALKRARSPGTGHQDGDEEGDGDGTCEGDALSDDVEGDQTSSTS